MSLSVANSEAVTVQSRVPGLVTIGPTFILLVADNIWLYMTKGSCHNTWLSNVQPWLKPKVSARCARSTTRQAGGSV